MGTSRFFTDGGGGLWLYRDERFGVRTIRRRGQFSDAVLATGNFGHKVSATEDFSCHYDDSTSDDFVTVDLKIKTIRYNLIYGINSNETRKCIKAVTVD